MIEYQYALQLGTSLDQFKVKKLHPLLINCRCPYCGDSKTDKTKARGYIIQQNNNKYYFYCHNCHQNLPFYKLLQFLNPELFNQYRLERFKDSKVVQQPTVIKKQKIEFTNIESLTKISALKFNHPVRLYCDKRKIPTKYHYKLFYSPDFYEFYKSVCPEKDINLSGPKDKRLIIPFQDENNVVQHLQARTLTNQKPKYFNIVFNPDALAIFGLDTVDFGKPVYVTEGPIDAMFIPNAIALAGQHYNEQFEQFVAPFKDNIIFCYDNEPRNKYTIKAIEKTINEGYKVVIWPNSVSGYKDINDMVVAGIDVEAVITENTFSSITANVKLANWRKV
jgi:hypothetical protein